MSAPDTPTPEHAWLNQQFYENKPWMFVERRNALLALLFRRSGDLDELLMESVTVGNVSLQLKEPEDADAAAYDHLCFVAVEAYALLHHAAETLLRLIQAHQRREDGSFPPSPALALTRMRSFRDFRNWLDENVRHATQRDDVDSWVRDLFGTALSDAVIGHLAEYLELFAGHVLDSRPYNAVKHGLAATGQHSSVDLQVDGFQVSQFQGVAISWIDDRGEQPGVRTRWYSLELVLAVNTVAATMMRRLWDVGYDRYVIDDDHEVSSDFSVRPLSFWKEALEGASMIEGEMTRYPKKLILVSRRAS